MFKKKTVLILGAGASCHLGYPLNTELSQKIIQHISSDKYQTNHGRVSFMENDNNLRELYETLRGGNQGSIDSFLKNHKKFSENGKIFIAYTLLKMENRTENHSEKNWYQNILSGIFNGWSDDLDLNTLVENNNLTIITFNYDCSLDYFLYSALHKMDDYKSVILDLIKKIKIIHVYGSIKDPQCNNFLYDYGRKIESNYDLFNYAKNLSSRIEVIGEKKQKDLFENERIKSARKAIGEAECVYLLGYGFHEENNNLLQLRENLVNSKKEIYITNFRGIGNMERKINSILAPVKIPSMPVTWMEISRVVSTKSVFDALSEDFSFEFAGESAAI